MDAPISFGTDGWRAPLSEFTEPRVRMVGQAVADYLADTGKRGGTVVVGYDARETSRGFADALAAVLAGNGLDVLVPSRDRPTPVVAWTVADRGLAGAVMVTASHNPPEYNGVKFIPSDGAPALPGVTDAIEDRLAEPDLLPEAERGEVREGYLLVPYADHLLDLLEGVSLDGLTVAYDAMHGSGRGVTNRLLTDCGADVERLHCFRDPEFGGTPPEPSAENLRELVDAVRDGEAALGVANDGDADRLAVATPRRGYLDENLFFAAIYDYLLEENTGSAVRTVSTSFLVDRVAAAHGEQVVETPVGFKWVAASMADHDALIGGEESGGFTVRGHIREKDGVLMALLAAAAEMDESLDDRVDRLEAEFGEIHHGRVSIDCPDDRKAAVFEGLEERIPESIAGTGVEHVGTKDGFKLLLSDGAWLLVRPSGTEPKLRIYAEGGTRAYVDALLEAGRGLVEPLV